MKLEINLTLRDWERSIFVRKVMFRENSDVAIYAIKSAKDSVFNNMFDLPGYNRLRAEGEGP